MNNNEYRVGVNRGLPVGMGYFSVSFGFGAMAVSQGLKTLDAVLISATNLTSAGQFAGLTLIVAAATLWEMVLTQLVINSRYALMSLALSQRMGEKIGLLEDEAVQDILDRNYGLTLDYAKAGSLDMVTADHEGRNFLFPSSQTALEYYQQLYGAPDRSPIVFTTPIVLYTHRPILEAFQKEGLVTERDGVYYMDMAGLVAEIEAGTAWADLGLPELYGTVAVNTTDPVRSNSGNMFAGLLANVLCGGVADEDSVEAVLPRLQAIFEKLGYMEASSSDLFDQFLKTGMGAKPMIAGYENQLLEFAVENPEDWEQLKDDIVLIYPTPTVWSSHIYIALDEAGEAGIDALMDEEIQRLAWENHGFRTEVSGTGADEDHFGVPHLAAEITQVAAMPRYAAMEKIIAALS